MEGTQQQTTISPVVFRSHSCPRGSKNRLSATQVPTQEGGGRGEFHSDATLTQSVQGAQAARVKSINPQVSKLTQKPTKVTTTKTVRDKEVELTLYVFDVVYQQESVPSAMLEKVKPVLDASYKPYVSDGNQEEDKKPKFYQTDEGQLVLKKVAAFYTKVPMSCVVSNANKSIRTAKKPAHKRIPDIKCIILLWLMQESGDYKAAVALVGVDPKYALKTFNKFIDTGQVLAAEKSLRVSTMLTKEHKWAICQWITWDCHLKLANIQAVADPELIRQKVVHLGIKQWNNCAVALLHPDSTSDKDV
ncbi:hypothetical protein DSO57_1034522 [Entomophthora muscae]|uniref:Uncharacterized protein n=1 Tax=Entomophthora muscae TaxID=34485 RepID=A0ACC2S1R2_9FUNG|nr:hypothetical protein DSO57_1034522 [Entomophthora muscae]